MYHSNNTWDNKSQPLVPYQTERLSHRQNPAKVKPLTIEDLFPKLDRWSIGYDSFFNEFQNLAKQATKAASYPPYDVVNYDDDTTLVSIAVAGFDKDDLTISVTDGVLQVGGAKKVTEELEDGPKVTSEHKGIAQRPFHLTFAIAEYYEVVGSRLENGMLYISLRKNLPEEKKPKIIEIN